MIRWPPTRYLQQRHGLRVQSRYLAQAGPEPNLNQPFVEERQPAQGFLGPRRLAHTPPMPSA
jgi:hypothetical protein